MRRARVSAMLTALLCAACAPLPEPVPLEIACTATDGDTIRCGEERIRLLAIDAPEMAGHCRAGRICAPGDPEEATRSLAAVMEMGPKRIIRLGQDRYGRTLALVKVGEIDLSCHQLATGNAVYVQRWDNRKAVARTCPDLARGD